jgi:hypothetical protein
VELKRAQAMKTAREAVSVPAEPRAGPPFEPSP